MEKPSVENNHQRRNNLSDGIANMIDNENLKTNQMIKISKNILTVLLAFFLMAPAFAQDNRRLETKVADVLAQFPAQNGDHTSKLMLQMSETGAPGIGKFCDMVVLI